MCETLKRAELKISRLASIKTAWPDGHCMPVGWCWVHTSSDSLGAGGRPGDGKKSLSVASRKCQTGHDAPSAAWTDPGS